MTDVLSNLPGFIRPSASARPMAESALPRWIGTVLIAIVVTLSSVHVAPFLDLQTGATTEVKESGNLLSQVVYTLLFLAALAALSVIGLRRLLPLVTPLNLTLVAWIVLSTALSAAPAVSARKLTLTFMCIFLAAAILLLARSVKHFGRVMALTAFWILVLSYVSVALAPDYTIHSRLDVREPELAGAWRGPFEHKNEAGTIMVQFVFIGLLAYSTGSRWLGAIVAVGAATFLAFTLSKTAMVLLPLILFQVWLARLFTNTPMRLGILFGPLALLGIVSLGSFFIKPLGDVLAQVMPDANFTGRTDIWQVAVDNIAQKPITGWGFGAFWRTGAGDFGGLGNNDWVLEADHAHNSYLDTALFMGIPGLVLTLLVFVAEPFRDLQKAEGGRHMDPGTTFFVSMWLYTLCTSFFETVLFQGNGLIFILFMTGIFGLRYRTKLQPT